MSPCTHHWIIEPPNPERGTLTGVCRLCKETRSFPKSVYAKGKASSEQAQQRLRRTLGKR